MQDNNNEKKQLSLVSANKMAESSSSTGDKQQSVPVDFMKTQSLFEHHMLRVIGILSREVKQMERRVSSLAETTNSQTEEFSLCFESLRKCQSQTAEYAGSIFERHALWPAIRTIVKLADEIDSIKSKSEQFKTEETSNSNLGSFQQELGISASIAAEQLACLDIERIIPVKGDVIDTGLHRVCGCVATDNKELHGKINEIIKPGIVHRKSVIEPASVSVFRYSQEGNKQKEQ